MVLVCIIHYIISWPRNFNFALYFSPVYGPGKGAGYGLQFPGKTVNRHR